MVQKIPEEAYAQKGNAKGIEFPVSVDWNCPDCERRVNFSMSWSLSNTPSVLNCKSRCPGCGNSPDFIFLGFGNETDKKTGELYIYPAPKTRGKLNGLHGARDFGPDLEAAYESSIKVFNVQEWNATAVMCRRLLEGIAAQFLPEEKQKLSLAKRLHELPAHLDLQEPLFTLADLLRIGGNLGAHFDLEKTPDDAVASMMMDLIEYLIDYIYILPNKIDELRISIEELSKDG